MTVRTALANSYNIPAVKLLDAVGVGRMLERAQAMGLRSLTQDAATYGLSLTLGGGEVTLLDLTTPSPPWPTPALMSSRRHSWPSPTRRAGRSRWPQAEVRQAVSPAAAFQVTDILSDNAARTPAFGANNPLRLSQPAAVKTGTTSDWRDNWTVGYTRYLVAGVWAGNSDGHPMRNTSGLTGAAPIWNDFMQAVLARPGAAGHTGSRRRCGRLAVRRRRPTWRSAAAPADWPAHPASSAAEGGEFYSRAWLEATGDDGPLADSVALVPSAPVYVDRGQGAQWTAYCQVEPAVLRPLLRLPAGIGLSAPASARQPTTSVQREREQAIAWSAAQPHGDQPGAVRWTGRGAWRQRWRWTPDPTSRRRRCWWTWPRPWIPTRGRWPATRPRRSPSARSATSQPGSYGLAEPVSHHDRLPRQLHRGPGAGRGRRAAGRRAHQPDVDQWGNQADAWSKDSAADYGRYDFPVNFFPNQYTLLVVDGAGNPLSAPVVVDHLQGDGGDAPCHSVIWRSQLDAGQRPRTRFET